MSAAQSPLLARRIASVVLGLLAPVALALEFLPRAPSDAVDVTITVGFAVVFLVAAVVVWPRRRGGLE